MSEPADLKQPEDEKPIILPEATPEMPKNWEVSVLEPVKGIQPSKFNPDKPWMATHFNIEKPDGTFQEIEAEKKYY